MGEYWLHWFSSVTIKNLTTGQQRWQSPVHAPGVCVHAAYVIRMRSIY